MFPVIRNPLVPCDAITIPVVSLAAWRDGYGAAAPVSAPLRRPEPSPYNYHHSPVFSNKAAFSPVSPVSVFSHYSNPSRQQEAHTFTLTWSWSRSSSTPSNIQSIKTGL